MLAYGISEVKEGRLRGRNKRKNKYMMIRYHLFQAICNQGGLHFEIVFYIKSYEN